MEQARDIIAKLDSFDAIADFTEPDFNAPIISLTCYRNIAFTYSAYATLRTAQGRAEEAAKELAQLHSVTRKAIPYARALVPKMIFTALINMNVETAHGLAIAPRCTRKAHTILRDAFIPLDDEAVSIRNCFILNYLTFKSHCQELTLYDVIAIALTGGTWEGTDRPNAWNTATHVLTPLALNKNRTIRILRERTKTRIEALNSTPAHSRDLISMTDGFGDDSWKLKNSGGQVYLLLLDYANWRAVQESLETRIRTELLAIELARNLGEERTMIDPYTGKPYINDPDTGLPFSPGPDGVAGSDDDVKLKRSWE